MPHFLTIAYLLASLTNVHQASANFSVDLLGVKDTRQQTWGYTGSAEWNVVFSPPSGYRVRILHVAGDLVAWPRILPGEVPIPAGHYAGVLLALHTTAPEGSQWCTPCADNTFLYRQLAIDAEPGRISFDADVSVGGLLGADNIAVVKVADWLNTEGTVHIEPTLNWVFRFEAVK